MLIVARSPGWLVVSFRSMGIDVYLIRARTAGSSPGLCPGSE